MANPSPNHPQYPNLPRETSKESTNQQAEQNALALEDFTINYEMPVPWWKKPVFLSLVVIGVAGLSSVELLPVDSTKHDYATQRSSKENILKRVSQGEVSPHLNTTTQNELEALANNESANASHRSQSKTHINTQKTTAQRINHQDIAIIRVDGDKASENTTTEIANINTDTGKSNKEQAKLNENSTASESKANPKVNNHTDKPKQSTVAMVRTKPTTEITKTSNQTTNKTIRQPAKQTTAIVASVVKDSSTQKKTTSTSRSKEKTSVTTTARGSNKPSKTKATSTTTNNNKPKQTATQVRTNTSKPTSQKSNTQSQNLQTSHSTSKNSSNKTNTSINQSNQNQPNSSNKQATTTSTKPADNANKPKPSTEISLSKEQIQKVASRMAAEKSAEEAVKKELN